MNVEMKLDMEELDQLEAPLSMAEIGAFGAGLAIGIGVGVLIAT